MEWPILSKFSPYIDYKQMVNKIKLGDLDPEGQGQNWRLNLEYCYKSWTAWPISSYPEYYNSGLLQW